MDWITAPIDFILHVDTHLDALIAQYGTATYWILFAIIFVETGVVLMPFLPGDSLLFAAGAIAGRGTLDPHLVFALLVSAAFLGDNCNYWIGRLFGKKLPRRLIRQEHLDRTHKFFERFGGMTVILARFVPIVRTFTPFVAGLGAMRYRHFVLYDIAGAVIWVGVCNYAGYFFGSRPFVKENFTLVVLGIVFVSILPAIIGVIRARAALKKEAARSSPPAS